MKIAPRSGEAPSPDLAIVQHLAGCTYTTASEIARACKLGPATTRAHLVILETMCLVAGRQDLDSKAPRRVYVVTGEGRRKAGISDAKQV